MTREDHTRVPEQVYANYAIGHDTKATRTAAGEEALSGDDHSPRAVLWKYEALRQFGLELVPKCLAAECLPVHCLEGMFPSSAA